MTMAFVAVVHEDATGNGGAPGNRTLTTRLKAECTAIMLAPRGLDNEYRSRVSGATIQCSAFELYPA